MESLCDEMTRLATGVEYRWLTSAALIGPMRAERGPVDPDEGSGTVVNLSVQIGGRRCGWLASMSGSSGNHG